MDLPIWGDYFYVFFVLQFFISFCLQVNPSTWGKLNKEEKKILYCTLFARQLQHTCFTVDKKKFISYIKRLYICNYCRKPYITRIKIKNSKKLVVNLTSFSPIKKKRFQGGSLLGNFSDFNIPVLLSYDPNSIVFKEENPLIHNQKQNH